MPDDMPRLTVIEIGRLEARRFAISDQFERQWNGSHFSSDWAKARLYWTRIEATMIAQDFVRPHYVEKPKANFVIPMAVEVLCNEPVFVPELLEWCSSSICLSLETRRYGNGPKGSLVLPRIDWTAMRKD